MHDFNMFRALCSDSISVRFAAWHVQDALGTTMQCVAVERPASVLPCDEGEHGLQYVGGVKLARLGVALVGTLPQTPLRRAHLAPLREILGCRTSW